MRFIDNFLNQITMYRLVLYYLIMLVAASVTLSSFTFLPFSSLSIILSAGVLLATCFIVNKLLSFVFKVPANIESSYITALILTLIITPAGRPSDFIFLVVAGALAMIGKYVLFFEKRHIFNPAAAAVVVTGFMFGWHASWWVGTLLMLPFLLAGILIVIKIKRIEMVSVFLAAATLTMMVLGITRGVDPILLLKNTFLDSPILFFAFIMLTEPLTSPTRKNLQIIYGLLVGILFSSQLALAGYYLTPEFALLAGNLFAWLVGMKTRLALKLKEKINMAQNISEFVFIRPKNFGFIPGQYMEWTFSHKGVDSRGNRRFFTIASSPTEDTLRLGVRFEQNGSSFKRALSNLNTSQTVFAGQLGGDFVLPDDASKKLVFIAGGIGITPYRSIVKYLVDKDETRDIILFYMTKTAEEIVYRDVFQMGKKIGLKTVYRTERLDSETIKKKVPDYNLRTFYLSGQHGMVDAYKSVLKQIRVRQGNIVVDYFPGYA